MEQFWLHGTTPGGSNVYMETQGLNTSVTVTGIPINGNPLYVRLWSFIDGGWQFNDYVYQTEAMTMVQMVSPAPNSTLTAGNINFVWSGDTMLRNTSLDWDHLLGRRTFIISLKDKYFSNG